MWMWCPHWKYTKKYQKDHINNVLGSIKNILCEPKYRWCWWFDPANNGVQFSHWVHATLWLEGADLWNRGVLRGHGGGTAPDVHCTTCNCNIFNILYSQPLQGSYLQILTIWWIISSHPWLLFVSFLMIKSFINTKLLGV